MRFPVYFAPFYVALPCLLLATARAHAATDPCAALEAAYPEPGRMGLPGENAFRPLPQLAPIRPAAGQPGTLTLSIAADHVSPAAAGKPGYVQVGNYQVTDIPAFRIAQGPATSFRVIRPEDGTALPMSDACMATPEWGFAGTTWALVQGDTLDVTMRSRLDYAGPGVIQQPVNGAVPCRAANLHTHGLLIAPYHATRPGQGPLGDYVYDVTMPAGALGPNGTDSCGTVLGQMTGHTHTLTHETLHYVDAIPGQPGISSLASGQHPSGLFWYHPHPHGYAKPQVNGGTTGAITIGALTDYACPAGDGVPGDCHLANTNVRVMELKDTELQSAGMGGQWALVHVTESGFCAATGGTRHGECQGSDAGHVGGKWVFTINGVQYPTIRPGAGRTEVWRIVNASANVTYALSLAGIGANRQNLPFQVLSRDGVSVGQAGSTMHTQIIMFPATRVEIAIPAPPSGGEYALRNTGVGTGANGSGDYWPDMELARIVWPAAAAPTLPALPFAVADAPRSPPPALDESHVPSRCRFAPGDTRVVYFVHRFENLFAGTGQKEIFGLIAGIRHTDGSMDFFDPAQPAATLHTVHDVWLAGVNGADPDFPAFGHNPYGTICTVQGSIEPWELQNWTAEDHNFHPHQSRFTINPAGNFEYPRPQHDYPTPLQLGDQLVRQFAVQPGLSTFDTLPVPRGQSFCAENPALPGCQKTSPTDNLECSGEPDAVRCANPGKTSVIMDFSRAEQVGTFVYHCHILEHEDGGMMAAITVLCPPGNASCAAQQIAAAPICRASKD